MPILIITRLTLLEALRRKIVLAALLLGLAFLVLYNSGFYMVHQGMTTPNGNTQVIRSEASNLLLMMGLYGVNFLSLALGALMSADTLAGEIGSGTIQTLVAKPVRRWEIVVGKWLGFAALLALYQVLMVGGTMGSTWVQAQYLMPNLFRGVALIYLTSLLVMSVTLACSSMFSTMATGGIVFGLYGLAFIGGWVEQFGAFFKNEPAIQLGIVSSLLMPCEALWHRASYEMTSPLIRSLGFGASPFTSLSVPSPLMVVYAIGFLAGMVALAVWRFEQRDL